MASIYLHIPFCRKMCGYCDFYKTARLDRLPQCVEVMIAELEREQGFLSTRKLSTIYFGGGTPSLLSSSQVERLMSRISQLYDVSAVSEVTFEANPDDLTRDYLLALRSSGVNRLSIGVQSFDDDTLRFMNRRHSAEQALRAIETAREVGFDNIAIDLIFGVSGYGGERLLSSLRQSIALGVEHIAAYHLTIESGTPFARKVAKGEFAQVDEAVSEQEYELVRTELTNAGYNHYEISNYARAGRESRHNSAYWSGDEYLGIGAGAHSFSARSGWGERRWCDGDLLYYLSGEDCYNREQLTIVERRNEVVMTSLRRTMGLDLRLFTEMFGEEQFRRLLQDAAPAIKRGDLCVDAGYRWLRVPTSNFLRSDMIIEELFLL